MYLQDFKLIQYFYVKYWEALKKCWWEQFNFCDIEVIINHVYWKLLSFCFGQAYYFLSYINSEQFLILGFISSYSWFIYDFGILFFYENKNFKYQIESWIYLYIL